MIIDFQERKDNLIMLDAKNDFLDMLRNNPDTVEYLLRETDTIGVAFYFYNIGYLDAAKSIGERAREQYEKIMRETNPA